MLLVYVDLSSNIYRGLAENIDSYIKHIQDLKLEDVVYIQYYGEKASQKDLELIYDITLKLLFSQDARIVIQLMDDSAETVLINQLNSLELDQEYNRSEGEDYVILPFFEEYVIQGNITSFFQYDRRNIELISIPAMENITTFHNVTLYIGENVVESVRIFYPEYDIKILCIGLADEVLPRVPPYYDSVNGPVYGYVAGESQSKILQEYTNNSPNHQIKDPRMRILIYAICSCVSVLFIDRIYSEREIVE